MYIITCSQFVFNLKSIDKVDKTHGFWSVCKKSQFLHGEGSSEKREKAWFSALAIEKTQENDIIIGDCQGCPSSELYL